MKSFFTVIEGLIAIIVIGIISSIVIMSTKDVQPEANSVSLFKTQQVLQEVTDKYYIDHQTYPTTQQPTISKPQKLNLEELKGNYLRKQPSLKGVHYWVDAWGKVWASALPTPPSLKIENNQLVWSHIEGAKKYYIYRAIPNTPQDYPLHSYRLEKAQEIPLADIDKQRPELEGGNGIIFLVSAEDKYGHETAPTGP